ncbi:SET domain-containing protein [Lophiostoma macrostomum CBS 122681]|uniref:SET domain-containing protein n=1 Tax=Lophiostoma macrostomum CBS 122681 TaxID=1314788 RepID=A0A6A6STF8_9PLEO|nr:SET domain-containing protein [Lophiostoma macrostomum CBS 122681]
MSAGSVLHGVDLDSAAVRLVAAILSRQALERCMSLILSWRSRGKATRWVSLPADEVGQVAALDTQAQHFKSQSDVCTFLARLSEYDSAVRMENLKPLGIYRLSSSTIDDILRKQGLGLNKSNRQSLHNRLMNARKWVTISFHFGSGLLVLIPLESKEPYQVSQRTCRRMDDAGLQRAHQLLLKNTNTMQSLCQIGSVTEQLFKDEIEVEFTFEEQLRNVSASQVANAVAHLSAEALIQFLRPVIYSWENLWNYGGPWPRPPDWEGEWPMDPTLAPGLPCDLCEATDPCLCLINCLPIDRYRIIETSRIGRGIIAHAQAPGEVAFRKNAIIGELTGELVPLDTYADGLVMNIHRPDVAGYPPICQLYCRNNSNWVRLVNHSCKPNAVFKSMVINGRVHMMLSALDHHILDGEEVTASYGTDYFSTGVCLCGHC